jgi:hypothetical protein
VVVGAAIARLGLYEDAFGQTRLRWYSTAFAWWLGAVFVLVGVAFVVSRSVREWLPTAILASAFVALLVVNVVDPDRLIMAHNLDRASAGHEFDVDHAMELSNDGVPTLVAGLDRLPVAARGAATRAMCTDYHSADRDLVSWNRSTRAANRELERICQ